MKHDEKKLYILKEIRNKNNLIEGRVSCIFNENGRCTTKDEVLRNSYGTCGYCKGVGSIEYEKPQLNHLLITLGAFFSIEPMLYHSYLGVIKLYNDDNGIYEQQHPMYRLDKSVEENLDENENLTELIYSFLTNN